MKKNDPHRKILEGVFEEVLKKTGLKGGIKEGDQIIPQDFEIVGTFFIGNFSIFLREYGFADVAIHSQIYNDSILIEDPDNYNNSIGDEIPFADPNSFSKAADSIIKYITKVLERKSANLEKEILMLQKKSDKCQDQIRRINGRR